MGLQAPTGVVGRAPPPRGDGANAVVQGVLTAVGPSMPFSVRGPMNIVVYGAIIAELTTVAVSLTASVDDATGLNVGNAISSPLVPYGTTIGTLPGGTDLTLVIPPLELGCWGLSLNDADIYVPGEIDADSLVGAAVSVPSNGQGVTLPAGVTVTAVVDANVVPTPSNIPAGNPGSASKVTLSAAPTALPGWDQTRVPLWLRFARDASAIGAGVDAGAIFTGYNTTFTGTFTIERSFNGGALWLPCNIGGSGQIARYTAGTPLSLTFGEPEKDILYRLNVLTIGAEQNIYYRMSAWGQAAASLSIPSAI